MKSKLQSFKASLAAFCKSIGVNMYHDNAQKETGNYGVWYALGERRDVADDVTAENVPIVTVQIWTKEEYSDLPEKLENYFDDMGYAWDCETYAVYEDTVQRYHYGWSMEVL